jgi:hypothetical protein
MLCYAMLCCAMLCYAMLCYAMLCYAMLCYAMLCYAMNTKTCLTIYGIRKREQCDLSVKACSQTRPILASFILDLNVYIDYMILTLCSNHI